MRSFGGPGDPGAHLTKGDDGAKARDGTDTAGADLPRRGGGDRARGLRRLDDADGRRGGGRQHGDAQPLLRQPPGAADAGARVRLRAQPGSLPPGDRGRPGGSRRLDALLDSVAGAKTSRRSRRGACGSTPTARPSVCPELRRTIEERLQPVVRADRRALEGAGAAAASRARSHGAWRLDAVLNGLAIQALTSEAELDRPSHPRRGRAHGARRRGGRRRRRRHGHGPAGAARPVGSTAMRAVTFQAPGVVSVEERPEPELVDPEDAVVRIEATGVCGSDLHIYHGRVQIEPGFTIGHEYVGTVVAAGERGHARGGRRPRARLLPDGLRELLLLPPRPLPPLPAVAHLRARRDAGLAAGHAGRDGARPACRTSCCASVPEGMSSDVALFAGDVMGTGFHAVDASGLRPGDVAAVLGLGPVGLCAVQAARAAGAAHVFAIDTVPERLEHGRVLRRGAAAPDASRTSARSCATATEGPRRRRLHRRGRRSAGRSRARSA